MTFLNKFLVPLCFIALLCAPGFTVSQQMNRLALVACLLLLVRGRWKFIPQIHHWLFFAWLVWCVAGIFFSDFPVIAFQGWFPYRGEGLIMWLVFTCLAITYWKTSKDLKPLAITCLISCLALVGAKIALHLFYRHVFGDIKWALEWYDRLFMPDVALAAFAVVASVISCFIHPYLILVGLAVVISTANRAAFIAWIIAWIISWNRALFAKWASALGAEFIHIKRIKLKHVLSVATGLVVLFFGLRILDNKIARIPGSDIGSGARAQWLNQAVYLSDRLPLTGYGLDTLSQYLNHSVGEQRSDLRRFIPDRVHNLPYDLILQTGWIGYTLLLLALGHAIGCVALYPDKQNYLCLSAVLAFIVFGLFNPHGYLAIAVTLTAFFGIRK